MAVAKALGARRVIAVDINQERLDFAKSYAATDIYLPVRQLLLLLIYSISSVSRYPLSNSTIHYYHQSLTNYPSELNNLSLGLCS
jgi:predicted RNA methylase